MDGIGLSVGLTSKSFTRVQLSFIRFLEAKGYPDLALEIATENDYKFELAVQLEKYVAPT